MFCDKFFCSMEFFSPKKLAKKLNYSFSYERCIWISILFVTHDAGQFRIVALVILVSIISRFWCEWIGFLEVLLYIEWALEPTWNQSYFIVPVWNWICKEMVLKSESLKGPPSPTLLSFKMSPEIAGLWAPFLKRASTQLKQIVTWRNVIKNPQKNVSWKLILAEAPSFLIGFLKLKGVQKLIAE